MTSRTLRSQLLITLAGPLALTPACYQGTDIGGLDRLDAYDGRVVLYHARENARVELVERPELVTAADGFMQLAVEVIGDQPITPDTLEIEVGGFVAPERLKIVHIADNGAVAPLPSELVVRDGVPILRATVAGFSIFTVARRTDPEIVFRHPTGHAPEDGISPCIKLGATYGKSFDIGVHTGIDYRCDPALDMEVLALGHGEAIFNATVNTHGFGRYTAERYLLENGRQIVCLSGHRNNTADLGSVGFVAASQSLGLQGNSGYSSPPGYHHIHTECKLARATTSASSWVGPCYGYCDAGELGNADDITALGYRSPELFYGARQPLIPELSHVDVPDSPRRTYVIAGKPVYGRLRLANPGPAITLSRHGVRGYGPDGDTPHDLFIDETPLVLQTDLTQEKVITNANDGHTLTPGLYRFFAFVEESGEEAATGYPITVEAVADPSTVIVDDREASVSAGMAAKFRRAGGYFLDHYRVPGDSEHWARWYLGGLPGLYRISAYIPDECTGIVTYGLFADGEVANKQSSDSVDQAGGGGWRALTFGGEAEVQLGTGGFVDLNPIGAPGSKVCIDAVKFERVTPAEGCGDGGRDPGEACDGLDLGNATCTSLGYASGVLACSGACTFDTSACVGDEPHFCGDDVQDRDEACDGPDLGGASCQSLGYAGGTLACSDACTLDAGSCYGDDPPPPVCGDNHKDPGEACDGIDFGGATCESLGFTDGELICSDCALLTAGCSSELICEYSIAPKGAPYSCPGGIVMPIAGSIDPQTGELTVSSPGKQDGYGPGTYRVLVFSPNDTPADRCKAWNVVKATKALAVKAASITFPAFPSLLQCSESGDHKAYCIAKEDGGSITHFCSDMLVADYQ